MPTSVVNGNLNFCLDKYRLRFKVLIINNVLKKNIKKNVKKLLSLLHLLLLGLHRPTVADGRCSS